MPPFDQAVVAAAIAGYGVAQLPYQVAEASVRDGRLRRVLGDYTTPVGGRYAVYPAADTFRLGQGIHRACSRAIGRHRDQRG